MPLLTPFQPLLPLQHGNNQHTESRLGALWQVVGETNAARSKVEQPTVTLRQWSSEEYFW